MERHETKEGQNGYYSVLSHGGCRHYFQKGGNPQPLDQANAHNHLLQSLMISSLQITNHKVLKHESTNEKEFALPSLVLL